MRILTTPYDLPDLRGRHEYIEVFRGLKSESDAEIAENSHFWMGTRLSLFSSDTVLRSGPEKVLRAMKDKI